MPEPHVWSSRSVPDGKGGRKPAGVIHAGLLRHDGAPNGTACRAIFGPTGGGLYWFNDYRFADARSSQCPACVEALRQSG